MHVHPPSPPLCIPPPAMCIPPSPEMKKDEAADNKKKMQVCLPKHNYKLDKNLMTVKPRAVDPHFFMRIRSRIRIQLKILMRIRIRGGKGSVSQKCASPLAKS